MDKTVQYLMAERLDDGGVCGLCVIVRKPLIPAISLDHKKEIKEETKKKLMILTKRKGGLLLCEDNFFFFTDSKLFEIY